MEQEEVKKTIEDLKEKSVQVFNAENQKKAVRFVDTFFGWMYSASYFFIALLVGLFSLILIGSVFYAVFHGPKTDIVPTYKEVKTLNDKLAAAVSEADTESVEVNKKYGDEIIKICKLTEFKPEVLVKRICKIEKKHRKAFVYGMLDFLEDAKADLKEKDFNGGKVAEVYIDLFRDGLKDIPRREETADAECKMAWCLALFSLYSILIALILPLLIQIRKNTKKE